MTKKHSAAKAFAVSLVSLVLCFSMLIGTTFAWFTDSVTSGSNIIASGTLDIVLEYWDGDSWEDAEGTVIPFVAADGRAQDQILWEPGCTYEMAPFRVRNEGNLCANILILLNGVDGSEKLMEVIELKTRINNIPDSLLNGSGGNVFQKFEDAEVDIFYGATEGNVVFDHSLAGKGQVTDGTGHTDTSPEFTIVGRMAETAGNEYQGLVINGISITVLATQQAYESDSFNKYYDQKAPFPTVDHAYIADGAPATTIGNGKVAITVPAGVPAGGYQVKVSNDNTATDENGLMTFSADIELLKDGVKVQADGITRYLVEINIGADMLVAKLLHNGNEITNYNYDSAQGVVSFETDSFSPFAVIFEKSKAVKVTSADDFRAAISNLTAPAVIDATGVTLEITEVMANGSAAAFDIPAGVTIKGAIFTPTHRGGNYVMLSAGTDNQVVFENCTFDNAGKNLVIGTNADGPDSVIYNNCAFTGSVITNFVDNPDGVAEFNDCTFVKASSGIVSRSFVEGMGGTHNFNNCTFDYTGVTQSSMGVISSGCVNVYSESEYSTTVVLNGCTRINCGTRKYGPNSTLIIK